LKLFFERKAELKHLKRIKIKPFYFVKIKK